MVCMVVKQVSKYTIFYIQSLVGGKLVWRWAIVNSRANCIKYFRGILKLKSFLQALVFYGIGICQIAFCKNEHLNVGLSELCCILNCIVLLNCAVLWIALSF